MTHYLVEGQKARLMSTLQRGDALVLVWAGAGARWVKRAEILVVDDIASEGLHTSVSGARSDQDGPLQVCSCHGDVVWDVKLLDEKERCPLTSSQAMSEWLGAMNRLDKPKVWAA